MASSISDSESHLKSVTSKKNSKSSKDHTYDSEWIKNTNAHSFLTEERRLSKKPVTKKVSEKRLHKFNIAVNSMTPEQLDEELRKRHLSTSGEIDILRFRLKHHFEAQLTYECESPLAEIEQHFDYIAVVDFEATCERDQQRNIYQNEIIEFPIVLIDVQQQTIIDKFQSYCRPTTNPILSQFCTELTGIQQHQVDAAPLFPEVLHNVETWLNERNLLSSSKKRKLGFATDGPWDFANFLRIQCHFSSVPYPQWAKKWINIRKEFTEFYPVRRCGIGGMLKNLGLTFEGRAHSGLDDATNIARIALELIKDGCVLLLNDGIHASDPHFATLTGTHAKDIVESKEVEDDGSIIFEA